MSKAVKCPSCRMKGKANGEDYALVATHRRRPVVQCFWCDSQVLLPRFRRPVLIEIEPMFEAVFEFKRAVDYDSLVSLMALEGDDSVSVVPLSSEPLNGVDTEAMEPEPHHTAPTNRYSEPEMLELAEPEMLEPAACEALPMEPETYPVDGGVHNLLQLANHVGWIHPINRRYEPEFMNIQLPPRRPMTQRQEARHEFRMMMKYFCLNGGGKEQKRRETAARRVRISQARQLRRERRRLRLDLRRFEAGEAI